MIYLAINKLSV